MTVGLYYGWQLNRKNRLNRFFRIIGKIDFFQSIFSIFSIREIDLKLYLFGYFIRNSDMFLQLFPSFFVN